MPNFTTEKSKPIAIIGAGLAGSECALTLAKYNFKVKLFDMKPFKLSPAHSNIDLAELVCSNSLRSDEIESSPGLLKQEMRLLNSFIMQVADQTRVPAGKALAVDRSLFSKQLTQLLKQNPLIEVINQEIKTLTEPELNDCQLIIIAAGPLASDDLTKKLQEIIGCEQLYFYDAIAPIVSYESLDMNIIFKGSRYNPEEKDYLNCPFTKDEYFNFYNALLTGEKMKSKNFEEEIHFEGCMPIESLAARGEMTLAFGPLKPVGLINTHTQQRPFAVMQLRSEDINKSMYNLVGCQTKLTYTAQEKIFRLVPGLKNAEFIRLGSMHRNTYINAPECLTPELSLKNKPNIFLIGQITGVEGYIESTATGLCLGLWLSRHLKNKQLPQFPKDTASGALLNYLQIKQKKFQPSNINFGLMPELEEKIKKQFRKQAYAQRSTKSFAIWYKQFMDQPIT